MSLTVLGIIIPFMLEHSLNTLTSKRVRLLKSKSIKALQLVKTSSEHKYVTESGILKCLNEVQFLKASFANFSVSFLPVKLVIDLSNCLINTL